MPDSYTTLTIQRPLTVRTVDIDIPDEEWSEVSCYFSINKTFTFLAAKRGINIYLKPHTRHPAGNGRQYLTSTMVLSISTKTESLRLKLMLR